MDRKLTLSLNAMIVDQAKHYAKDRGTSLSRMIENYLAVLTQEHSAPKESEISPLVKRLLGVAKVDSDAALSNYREEYSDYLTTKYK